MRVATQIMKKWSKEKILAEISKRTKETNKRSYAYKRSKRILTDLLKLKNDLGY